MSKKLTKIYTLEELGNRDVTIYCLRDPRIERNYEVRYIGKTISLLPIRVQGHCDDPSNTKKTAWIKSLKKLGLLPTIEALEVIPGDGNWSDREKYWISYGKSLGWRLTNHTTGGERGFKLCAETVAKLSKSNTGKTCSPETKEKLRQANLGKKQPPGFGERLRELFKGRVFTEDWMDKIRAANRSISNDSIQIIIEKFNSNPSEKVGVRIKALAAQYDVCDDTIRKIIKGKYLDKGQGLAWAVRKYASVDNQT